MLLGHRVTLVPVDLREPQVLKEELVPLDHKETLVNLDLLVQPDLLEQPDLKVSKLVSCVCHTNKVMLKIIVDLFTFCFWSFEGELMHKVGFRYKTRDINYICTDFR